MDAAGVNPSERAIQLKHCSIAVKLHWVQLAQRKEGNLVVHVVVESALIPHATVQDICAICSK